jgi:ATP-dependent Lon protease
MNYPVYVLELNDDIPIPGQVIHLLISNERLKYFSPVEFSLGRDQIKRRILFAIPKTRDTSLMMEDLGEYLDNVYDIGLLGSITEPEDINDEMSLYTIKIEGRAFVTEDVILDIDTDGLSRIYCTTQFYIEELEDDEHGIYADIEALSKVISKNSDIFEQTLCNLLTEEVNLFRRMDYMADYVFSEKESRIKYLQEESNLERWLMTTTQISDLVMERKHKKKSPATNSKIEKQERNTSSSKNLSYKERLDITAFPEMHRPKISEEISRLDSMPGNSTEASMLKDYLSWVFKIPWGKSSERDFSLKALREDLNRSHYGLDDVKDYLIEHMCIEKIKGNSSGAIICLSGPPGTGKSSIARTLAEASGRSFQTVSLGGIGDEADIVGHRRTYISSKCGRIINALCNAGSMNPCILLDELDKLDTHRGSAASALLSALDNSQNKEFIDRYIELEVDLSKILFVATVNYEDRIPEALKDRLEFIRFREYEYEERHKILNDYLLPKIVLDYNIKTLPIEWTDEAFSELAKIKQVRQIEQRVRRLLRVAATNIYAYEKTNQTINKEFIDTVFKQNILHKPSIGFCR